MSEKRIAVLDIGGTHIKAGLFIAEQLTDTLEASTPAKNGAPALLKAAGDLLEPFLPFDAIGISTAGQVDPDTGIILYANDNLPGYTGTNVRAYFEERFECPCAVMNDAYCAALGEGTAGAAAEFSDYICITYGTGVGGGIFLDHKPYYGTGTSANPMIGGLITHPEHCCADDPFAGTYERYASTTALVQNAMKLYPQLNNGRKIFAQIHEPEIRIVLDDWMDEIVFGLLSILHLFNIPCLVLGGGVLEQKIVLNGIQERVRKAAIPGFQDVTIRAAKLGNRAGLYGAMRNATVRLF